MTTMPMTDADRLPLRHYLGPWPLRPGAMFFATLVIALATTANEIRADTAWFYLLSALVVAAGGASTLWLFQRFTPDWSQKPLGYAIALSSASAVGIAVRGLTGTWVLVEQLSLPANVLLIWGRTVIFGAMVLALLGVSSRRLQTQVNQTEQALSLVRDQADALLRADEAVRQQVASLLHDKVQAGLIAACLYLQDVGRRIPETERESLKEVVASLEHIRALDVRRAVHSLSPNLSEVDFESALTELIEFYEPAMTTTLDLELSENIPYEIRLGAYRIIEQALLNAAAHGAAQQCRIAVTQSDRHVLVELTNDGEPLPATATPGLGTTLTSSWCRTLGGEWSRWNIPGGGVRLSARLPLE